jgi:gliding motility-associated-like protein
MHRVVSRSVLILVVSLAGFLAVGTAESVAQGTALPTRGKRFWTGFMQNGFGAQTLRVHIVSSSATSGTVSIPLAGWSAPFTVAANSATVISVPLIAENIGSELIQNKGVLIQSQDSVNVFISSFQNFTHDLSQILPEHALGGAYRVESYHGIPNFNNIHKSELLVVATQDGTQVRITPVVNTAAGNPAHVPFVVNLNAGQTYQVQAAQDVLDLTGTLVEATESSGSCRPFVVMGGSTCATLPGPCSACDAIFEQIPPLASWGSRYFTAPIQGVNVSTYRILAHENNTQVTIGGGGTINLNAGQRHEVNGTTAPVCIQANRPVSVAQLMEGMACAGNGDPSLLILTPHDRLSKRAIFQTPTSPQLSQHSISLVVPPAAVGEVTFNGVVVNPALFLTYPGCSERRHARMVIPAGTHRVESQHGFQLYMFGTGAGESYAASVHDLGTPPVVQDSVICSSVPITLNAPEPLVNAQWTAASAPTTIIGTGNSLSLVPTASDSYTVSGAQAITGCPRSFTFHVGVPISTIPALTANGAPSVSVCQYEQVQLGITPMPDPAWFTVQWLPAQSLNNPSIPNPVATPTSSTWYRVQVSSPAGCGSFTDSVFVHVSPGQVLDMQVSAAPAQVCAGGTTTLSSQTLRIIGSDAFNGPPASLWASIQGGTVSTVCGSVSGSALYFNGNGQRFVQTGLLNTLGGGQLRFHLKIANGLAPCDDADPGENVVLEFSTTNGITWNTLATYNENAYPDFTAITATIPAAAQAANTMFRFRQLTHSGLGQDNWLLDDVVIARWDNSWLGYQWNPATTVASPNAATTTATPAASGWYVLNGTDPSSGCTYRDSVFVTVHPGFALQVTPSTTLCASAGLQLQATPVPATPVTYSWSPAASLNSSTSASPVATPSQTTTYSVTATAANGCSANGQVTVTVGQLLDLSVSAEATTLCQGQQVQLTATAAGASNLSYSWSNAGTLSSTTSATPIATPGQTTTYVCTVTDIPSGCSLSASITIHVTTGYTAYAGADITLCSTLGHQLTVQHNVPNASYQWSPAANVNAANIQSPTIMVDFSATYTVVITDVNGCSVSDAVIITRAFEGQPGEVAVASCADAPPQLSAPIQGVAYSWNTGQTTPAITPPASGSYTLTTTNAQGCQAITTFLVTLHALPVVELGPDVNLCGAASHLLDAGNAGSNHTWLPSGTGQTLVVTSSGTYQVTVTNTAGCSSTDAVTVNLNPLPSDELQDITTCVSTPPALHAGNAGSSYLWNTGAATASITATLAGTYTVEVTTAAGCSAIFDALVTLAPAVNVFLGNDTAICVGQQLQLDAGEPGASHAWSTGASSQTITVTGPGTYSVVVSNGYCSASDAIVVQVDPLPVQVLADAIACEGSPAMLNAGNADCTHLWSTGQSGQFLETFTSGSYSVTITTPAGCSATHTAGVQIVPIPHVELGPDTVLCDGEVLLLDGGADATNWNWNTGSLARFLSVAEAGTYSVTAGIGNCTHSDAITVLFNPRPPPVPERIIHVCLEEEPRFVVLSAGDAGSIYRWSTGAQGPTLQAREYGTYGVEITNVYGCQRTDSIVVQEYCPSTIFAPNTFTPDGDGLNDYFLPVGRNIARLKLMIFDRWGTMIYQENNPVLGWDGRYRGEFVTDDIYVWRINYRFQVDESGRVGMEQEMTGHIQVLR